jgi:hypothetical protein
MNLVWILKIKVDNMKRIYKLLIQYMKTENLKGNTS